MPGGIWHGRWHDFPDTTARSRHATRGHGETRIVWDTRRISRIKENIDVFGFDLPIEEMAAIAALDTGHRGGPEPDAITLEAYGRDIPDS